MKVHELISALQDLAKPDAEVMTPDFGLGDLDEIHITVESDDLIIIEGKKQMKEDTSR